MHARSSKRLPHRRPVAAALVAAVGCAASHAALAQAASEPPTAEAQVGAARAALEKWVDTRRLIAEEKADWKLGEEVLRERIELVKSEIESLQAKIDDAKGNITEADKARGELVDRNEALKDAASALRETVVDFEARTRGLLAKAPDPAVQLVRPLSQRIPDDPEATETSLSQRFQNVIGILNELDKFNRRVTLTSEVRRLGDGGSAEVRTVYVGLGQGYYVGANNAIAGRGAGGLDGWTWTSVPDAADEIDAAIDIYENTAQAGFVQLPIEVTGATILQPTAPATASAADEETTP